jgi:hypothetical protein
MKAKAILLTALLCLFAAPATATVVMDNNGRYVETSGGAAAHSGYAGSKVSKKRRGAHSPAVWAKVKVARGGEQLVAISCGGVSVRVAASAATKFAGFCAEMSASGYHALSKGTNGYRPWGTCSGCDMHPKGLAIDYSQAARDKTYVRMDRRTVSVIAKRHGLVSGGDWCNGDLGHFEVNVGRNAAPCSTRRNLYQAVEQFHQLSAKQRM